MRGAKAQGLLARAPGRSGFPGDDREEWETHVMSEHALYAKLQEQLAEGRLDRREFVRYAALLGVSASAAYAFAGRITGQGFAPLARADTMPKGGTLRIAMRCKPITDPHTFSWIIDSNIVRQVCGYLTRTGADNITRPDLAESWEASDDLKTWTFHIRKGVKWHDGRDFTADDVAWNLHHVLNPDTGSSVLGLMKGYMMNDDGTELWDPNAIQVVDDHTLRLNARNPAVAVPEHMFHYPMLILDPHENGAFKVGSNGTGAFKLVEYTVTEKGVLENAHNPTWYGEGPYLDKIEFLDLGDDPSAAIGALASRQVLAIDQGDSAQLAAFKAMPNVQILSVNTADTAVARGHCDLKPFDDARVRKALRMAVDSNDVLQSAQRGLGTPGEHHHVSPVHPEYYKLPAWKRDVEGAKKLLADAGYADGIDIEIACKKDPAWELLSIQAMVEQWKEADIRVKINVMPSDQFWEVWTKVPFGYTSWAHRPLGIMVLNLAYRTGVPWNESHYSNPDFDAKLTAASGILDVDKRREAMKDLETIMQQDGPITQPVFRALYTAADDKVKGYGIHPDVYLFCEKYALAT
jgi:peptide/nickel transport system substrate-binding protein